MRFASKACISSSSSCPTRSDRNTHLALAGAADPRRRRSQCELQRDHHAGQCASPARRVFRAAHPARRDPRLPAPCLLAARLPRGGRFLQEEAMSSLLDKKCPHALRKPLPDGRGSAWRGPTPIGAATVRERLLTSHKAPYELP